MGHFQVGTPAIHARLSVTLTAGVAVAEHVSLLCERRKQTHEFQVKILTTSVKGLRHRNE